MKDLFTILTPTIISWLGYLWVSLLVDIGRDTKGSNSILGKIVDASGVFAGILAFASILGPPIATGVLCVRVVHHTLDHSYSNLPLGMGLVGAQLATIGAVWTNRKWRLGARAGSVISRLVERYRKRDAHTLKKAQRRVRKLCAIIPEIQWSDLRVSLESMVGNTLPPLLKRREELRHAVRRIGELIAKSDKTTLTEFSQAHLQHVIAHKRTAETELENVQKEIGSCLDSLELLEADLLMVNASGDAEPVTRQLGELQERIANITAGSKDIERYMDQHPDLAEH